MNAAKLISLDEAIERLKNGAVGVIPTDTIYGLAASAHNKAAVISLYALKHREQKPGTVIAADTEQLRHLGIEQHYLAEVASLWPAPLSIVLPFSSLPYLNQGVDSLAVRVVADPILQTFLEQTGPLLTSSANYPGQPESKSVQDAWHYFEDDVNFYIDGGDISHRQASTVARLLPNSTLEVLRQGVVDVSSFGL